MDNEANDWSSSRDPILSDGLALIDKVAEKHASAPFRSAPPATFEWDRLFKLQMAYLFLWTIIERYATIAYGPILEPTQKVARFGEDPRFEVHLRATVQREHRLFDTRSPRDSYRLDKSDPRRSADYYFQVRNNLTHRGKGAWQDAETVRQSLRELLAIVQRMIEATPGMHSGDSGRCNR